MWGIVEISMHINQRRQSLALITAFRAAILLDIMFALNTSRYVRPEDCTWEPIPDLLDISMTCTISALHGEPNPTRVSLVIRCTDEKEMSQKHKMAVDLFGHLTELQSLSIERYKFDHLAPSVFWGFSSLKHFTLSTSDWETTVFRWETWKRLHSVTMSSGCHRIFSADLASYDLEILLKTLSETLIPPGEIEIA